MKKSFIYINRVICFIVLISAILICSCKEDIGRILDGPVGAEFQAESTSILSGGSVTFADQSTGEIAHWSWTFEGGTPKMSAEQNPTVVYKTPGNYEVKLVVSNVDNTDVMTKSAYINVTQAPQPVTAEFSADKLNTLTGENVSFTDNSEGGPTTWSWEFSTGSGTVLTSSAQNPVMTFDIPGIYSVKLLASNSLYSDEVIKQDYITVIDANAVAADFSADTRMTYTGQSIAFADASIGNAKNWEWTFEGGTPSSSTDQNPTVTYSTAGKYKVTLVASNDVNSSTVEKTGFITVVPGDGLVGYFPFDGSENDMGPLNLGVVNNAVTFDGTDRNNNDNSTAVFDGLGYIKVNPDNNKQFASAYSVGVWLKTDNPEERWVWCEGRQDDIAAWFRLNNNSTSRIYSFLPQKASIINVTSDDQSVLSDNVWHYVVCVRESSGSGKLYVDGTLIKENSFTLQDLTNDYGFYIGAENNAVDDIIKMFIGQLDDMVIYNRALSDGEVTQLSSF